MKNKNNKLLLEMLLDLVNSFTSNLDFKKSKKALSLKPIEFNILSLIYYKGPQKMKDLADYHNLTKSAITIIVDKLESNDYLKRIRSSKDRRIIHIHLTKAGKIMVEEFLEDLNIKLMDMLDPISDEELEVLFETVNKIHSKKHKKI
ncbi:MarR family transcriptional regulator [Oceanotoga sp. DSM 15011]|uniref:MarR family winged helix-turn-helix transcriptional regulator n=1 Tax=Oceanotoga sp. DSM 15011 TaxID=2984951 RepID=UPI0021F426B6|nr:MarR family transcriptional regulator [Oceanotoga sp. DSM 15011]UYP01394.1 MarR family transcriptional regulator [Oceanotoga sp. DSM 15011]